MSEHDSYPELKARLSYLPDNDRRLAFKAYEFARIAHLGQRRLSGEPYINHAIKTALYLADMTFDANTISAGLLHDVPEDTQYNLASVKKEFGAEIANLVDGVTKLGQVRLKKSWVPFARPQKEFLAEFERQMETLRKMFVAMSRDVRVILIKLADRKHNMETLYAIPKDKQARIAKETLEVYGPMAYRLGMGELKGQLEDLAFKYLQPDEFERTAALLKRESAAREKYLKNVQKIILVELNKNNIKGKVHSRIKHVYSLWKKLQKYDNDVNKIYDIVATRVIVKSVEECYTALGITHKLWRPLQGRIKDYIALPKPNGYRSLHTTVFGPGGHIIEIQIRTVEMHDEAENGIAAHWHYSESKQSSKAPKEQLAWIRELADWQSKLKSPSELSEGLRMDFFENRIFVFTPQGDVKDLPAGATPVDFAYSIHSEIGDHCNGAMVNGKMAKLDDALENGDVVEIITKKNSKPRSDWLNFVKTQQARQHISRYLG